jgi:hypothetical protein
MRGRSERLKIEIRDSTESDERIFIMRFRNPAKVFQQTDLLRRGKLTGPLKSQLKQAIKDSIEECFSAANRLGSSPSSEPNQTLQHGTFESEKEQVRRIRVRSLVVPTK